MTPSRARNVASLGMVQTLVWASSYYLPAMPANSMLPRLQGVGRPAPAGGAAAEQDVAFRARIAWLAGRARRADDAGSHGHRARA